MISAGFHISIRHPLKRPVEHAPAQLPRVFLNVRRTFLLQSDALVRIGCILRKQSAMERPVCAEDGSGRLYSTHAGDCRVDL